MILEIIVSALVTVTGQSCAAIDNGTNTAVWGTPNTPTNTAYYTDYGDDLGFDQPVPREVWEPLNEVVQHLNATPPAHKVYIQCD